MNDEKRAAIKALGDLTDSKNNPLIPTGAPEPIDPLLTPEGNELMPEGEIPYAVRSRRTAAQLVEEIQAQFKDDEVEIAPGVILERRASGAVYLIKDGLAVELEGVGAEDLNKVRAVLKL